MTLVYFLATIVLLVVIHEWGHFASARFFGVGVRSFTVGFGKQFVSWVDPKTGTSWGIAPYPVGGYVGLLGEKDQEQSNLQTPVSGKPFTDAPLHAKLLILLAGPLVNLIFAALLYAILSYSAPNPALPVLAKPSLGSPAAAAGIQSGDVISSLNGVAVDSWRGVQKTLLQLDPGQSITLGLDSGRKTVSIHLSNRPTVSAQQTIDETLGLRLMSNGLVVQKLLPEGAALKSGMQVGDVMRSINGVAIDHPAVLMAALQSYSSTSPPIAIEVIRDNQIATAFVSPQLDQHQTYKIGVQFAGLPALSAQSSSAFDALTDGVSTAYSASWLTVKAFGHFLLKPFNSDQLAGPLTIAKTAKESADRGWVAAVAFIAGLSISVGVLNLLPVPMLDGGQIVYHCVTGAATRLGLRFKIAHTQRLNQWWTSAGIGFVAVLTVLAFFTDFKRLFGF
jgi:regulator of sigma E protease